MDGKTEKERGTDRYRRGEGFRQVWMWRRGLTGMDWGVINNEQIHKYIQYFKSHNSVENLEEFVISLKFS